MFAIPGKQVHFAIWHCDVLLDEPAREAARAWAGSGAEEPRFVPLPSPYTLPDYSDEWYNSENNEYGIYLPAPAPATSLRDRASRAATISGHPTGVKALDGILSGGYLPSDALVGIGGANGQGKTTTALELLENLTAADPEALGVYVVLDEPELPIRARRLQRHGLDREQARAALNTDAEAEIKPDLVIVPGEPDETFEDLLEQVRAEAAGRQVNMVIDSVQKLRTRASLGMGTRERVAAASQALRTAVLAGKGKLRILFTSEVARGSGDLKDSGALDYDADLILVASLNAGETAVSYRVAKNRYGTKVTLQVPVDLASQRLDPPPPPGDDVVWSRVRGALASATGDGWLSQRAVETAAGGNRGKVRACLKARTGLDVESGPAGYRLKCAQP
ncbi:MAG TPA: ATPase domain-containing protein [Polyangiaceae bacterium]|nr:ATPase domain-containing protein [Polyangiaceae bacterium]